MVSRFQGHSAGKTVAPLCLRYVLRLTPTQPFVFAYIYLYLALQPLAPNCTTIEHRWCRRFSVTIKKLPLRFTHRSSPFTIRTMKTKTYVYSLDVSVNYKLMHVSYVSQQDDEYRKMGRECVLRATKLLETGDWKFERLTSVGDTIQSLSYPKMGKVWRVTVCSWSM